jgi:hypothetical protein
MRRVHVYIRTAAVIAGGDLVVESGSAQRAFDNRYIRRIPEITFFL